MLLLNYCKQLAPRVMSLRIVDMPYLFTIMGSIKLRITPSLF